MFSLMGRKILLPLACLSTAYYQQQRKCKLIEPFRANKPELVHALHTLKQDTVILVYNRESEQSLREKIIQIEELCEKNKISQLILVDQTDIRHLKYFTALVREDIQQTQVDSNSKDHEPVDLAGKIRILYVNPQFDTMKPFTIESEKTLVNQIQEIRGFVKVNPTAEELKKSFEDFNRTSVLKNCYNDTCVTEYKEKVRQLIELDLLKGKGDNFEFFVTSGKPEAQKVSPLIPQSSNKQEIYVHFNDILGRETELYTKWFEREGNKYANANQFLMMIKPRVHIISKGNFITDVFWYMSCQSNRSLPTFSINNAKEGLEKLTPDDVEKLKYIHQKLKNKVDLLILDTPAPSQLFRHVVSPYRYAIFQMTRKVPYPKMFLDIKSCKKQDMEEAVQKINTFLSHPKNYSPIVIYTEREKQINASNLVHLIESGRLNKFIFRVCGSGNTCAKSVYEEGRVDLKVPVFKLDGKVQNIGIDQGDYVVENGNVTPLEQML